MERITVLTSVQADLDRVWEFWTKPEHIINWNFATDEWCCPKAENELKPNGKFSWRMEARDGSMGFDFEGIYDRIVDKELISYTMSDGRKVDITFTQNDHEVKLSETFDPEETNSDEQHVRAGRRYLGILRDTWNRNRKRTSTSITASGIKQQLFHNGKLISYPIPPGEYNHQELLNISRKRRADGLPDEISEGSRMAAETDRSGRGHYLPHISIHR